MTQEQAKEILKGMSLKECIKIFNDNMFNGFHFFSFISEMESDQGWRNVFSIRFPSLIPAMLLESYEKERFKREDLYFFYDQEDNLFYSFSIKEDLLEITGEDFFLEEIINRNN